MCIRDRLKGWENKKTGEQKIVDDDFYCSQEYNYCGIQILSPEYLDRMIHTGVFSIIDEHLEQARSYSLQMFLYEGRCLDLGTPEAIRQASLSELSASRN